MPRTLAILLAAGLSGCLLDFPDEADGPYPCADDGDCADGFTCRDQLCARPGAVDAGDGPGDASADAGPGADAGDPTDAGDATDAGDPTDAGRDGGPADAGCAQTWCGDVCVDTQTNAEHCGACNVDCLGGACSFGRCRPVDVHRQPGSEPNQLAIAGGQLFWTDTRASGAVLGRAVDLQSAVFVVQSNVRYPESVAADGRFVAWTSLDELSGPRRATIAYETAPFGGAPLEAATEQANPTGLAIASEVLFWTTNLPLYVRSQRLGAAGPFDERRADGGSDFAQDVVVSDTEVLWADAQGDIRALPLDLTLSTAPRTVVSTEEGEASDLILHDGTLYWAESTTSIRGEGRIFSAPIATGLVTTVAARADPMDATHGAVDLAFFEGYLYYTTGGTGGRGGSLFRVPHTGGTPERLHAGAATDALRGVAVANGRVFWAHGEAILALPVP